VPLPPSANKPKNDIKWEIRKRLHPQFYDLWSSRIAYFEPHRSKFVDLASRKFDAGDLCTTPATLIITGVSIAIVLVATWATVKLCRGLESRESSIIRTGRRHERDGYARKLRSTQKITLDVYRRLV
jgi:hypothetical protein